MWKCGRCGTDIVNWTSLVVVGCFVESKEVIVCMRMDWARNAVHGALEALLGGIQSEVVQMQKLRSASLTSRSSGLSSASSLSELGPGRGSDDDEAENGGKSVPSSSVLSYRQRLLIKEEGKEFAKKEFAKREKQLLQEIAQLKDECTNVQKEVDRLRWEPKRARDNLVLLCVSLSAAFSLVIFALFWIAERSMLKDSWEDRVQGRALVILGSVLCFGAVPLTHMTGTILYGNFKFRFFQPGEGGKTYVILQAFGWCSYASFLLLALSALAYDAIYGVVLTAGVAAIIAQVLMVCSLLSYCPKEIQDRGFIEDGYSSDDESTILASEAEDDASEVLLRRKKSGLKRLPLMSSFGQLKDLQKTGMEADLWFDSDLSWNAYSSLRLDTDTITLGAFVLLQSSLIVISIALGFTAEWMAFNNVHSRVLSALSLLMMVIPALLTHNLGGLLFNRASWHFVEPFAGGTRFLFLQTVTWMLFGLCFFSQISFLGVPLYFASGGLKLRLAHTGLAAAVGHILLVLSISFYEIGETIDRNDKDEDGNKIPDHLVHIARKYRFQFIKNRKQLEWMCSRMQTRFLGLRALVGNALVVFFCNTHYMIFLLASITFYGPLPIACAISERICIEQPAETFAALVKWSFSIILFTIVYSVLKTFNVKGTVRITVLILTTLIPVFFALYMHQNSPFLPIFTVNLALFVIYNYWTYSGTPEISGCREWPAFRRWRAFWSLFQDYHGAELFTDARLDEFEKNDGARLGSTSSSVKQAIFGFHPHGIFPTSLIWLPNSPIFVDRFPGLSLTAMTASIIHLVPIMRDVSQWAGVRDVGRASVEHALQTGRSPMLVIGGMSEMFQSRSWIKNIAVHRGHRGFVRMAIRHGVPLVPIFSFGEHKVMDNVYLPRMQDWFRYNAGFPVPYFPYGRWYLPVNRRCPLTFCVGEPVFPKRQNSNPTAKEIEELHLRYFASLQALFEDNKQRCGFPDHSIDWKGMEKRS